MSIDPAHIGRVFGPHRATIERGRLRLFAKATGQRERIFHDDAAAAEAGYGSAVAPPTFGFCLEMDREDAGTCCMKGSLIGNYEVATP